MDGIGSGKRFLDSVSARITAITSGPVILAGFFGLMIFGFLVNGRPFGIAELKAMTGGTGILDMEVLYSPDRAYAILSAMGEAGRAFDLTRIVPLDMVVPFFYALFLATAITWILHRWLPAGSGWHRLNVVPVIGALCDYLENLGVVAMLVAWPDPLPEIARITMAAGLLKFSFSALAGLVIVAGLAGWAYTAVRTRSGAP